MPPWDGGQNAFNTIHLKFDIRYIRKYSEYFDKIKNNQNFRNDTQHQYACISYGTYRCYRQGLVCAPKRESRTHARTQQSGPRKSSFRDRKKRTDQQEAGEALNPLKPTHPTGPSSLYVQRLKCRKMSIRHTRSVIYTRNYLAPPPPLSHSQRRCIQCQY